jgi:hypothetical protein
MGCQYCCQLFAMGRFHWPKHVKKPGMHLDKPPVTAYALQGAADKLENVMIIGNNLHVDAFTTRRPRPSATWSWTVKPGSAH